MPSASPADNAGQSHLSQFRYGERLFRVTPGNFLVNRKARHQRRVLLYGLVWISFTAPVATDCEGPRQAHGTSEHQPRGRATRWRSLVFNVGIDTVEQAFTAQFASLLSKSFPDWQKNS